MNNPIPLLSRVPAGVLTVLARWLVGALFLYMGMNKVLHPVEFLKLLRQYDLIHDPLLLNSVAAMLPWFESFWGLLLVLGVAVRGTSLMLLLLLASFTFVVWQRALAMHTALAIPLCAVKFDCGCGSGEVFACHKLVENTVLLLLLVLLVLSRAEKWCLYYGLEKKPREHSV